MSTVSHAGDVGDVLAACAPFGVMGGDVDLVLYPAPGMVREPFTPAKVDRLRPLLEAQPYISRVRYSDHPEGRILDHWRSLPHLGNLADIFAKFIGVPAPDRQLPWFKVKPYSAAKVVIHRSPRYRPRSTFPWCDVLERYQGDIVMVGSQEEHRAFCDEWADVPYHHTPDYLALAEVIAGAELFVGNQSSPYWVALGLGQTTWCEQRRNRNDNCYWQRPRAYYDGAGPLKS